MAQNRCNKHVSLKKVNGFETLYLMGCDCSLPGAYKTICNVLIDREKNIIHIYDDLNHQSTSIFKEIDKYLVIELMSLLGIEYNLFKVIVYYAPIIKHPFIREFELSSQKLVSATEEDINSLFYEMAYRNEEIKK